MKIQIRNSVFETNSSSIHSLCIPKNTPYKVPERVNFCVDCYGWGPSIEFNPGNYLYTYLAVTKDTDRIQQLADILHRHGVKYVSFQSYDSDNTYHDFYIDHTYESEDWVNSLFADEEKMMRHLFTPGTVIYITNDNSPNEDILSNIGAARERNDEIVSLS